MSSLISRRMFLKGALAAAAGAAGAAGPRTQAFAAAHDRAYLATLIDIRKCIGCEACVQACRETNASKFPEPHKPFPKMYPSRVKVSDWSDRRDVSNRLTPYNWLFIQHARVKVNGEDTDLTIARGDGVPHLQPVADAMADANNLATAMVLAPVASFTADENRCRVAMIDYRSF